MHINKLQYKSKKKKKPDDDSLKLKPVVSVKRFVMIETTYCFILFFCYFLDNYVVVFIKIII